MATFVLKKYSDKIEEEVPRTEEELEAERKSGVEKRREEFLTIHVTGSISSIIAQALQKTLSNKSVDIELVEGAHEEEASDVIKAISTEDINDRPVETLRSIGENDVVFISSEGFNSRTEDWFLYNLGNKTKNVFYTIESFMSFVSSKFEDKEEESDES